jgi:RNA polymerase sigma factor (sigma-70 family)
VLYQAMMTLKPYDQAILVLRFFEQMSHEQIAGVLNQRPATVRVGLSRALEKLRRCFKMDDDPVTARGK